jgi:cytochrome P450
LAWVLHSLSLHPDVQNRLRKELQGLSLPTGYSEDPIEGRALEALNSLPLLDAVVRETLRLYPAIPHITRTAIQDDVIHLEKPFKDRHGVLRNVIK